MKVNKELRSFSESVFFGLGLRQLIFALLAVGVAVGLYFLLRNAIGTSEIGWICILGALPFGMLGFFKYQDMPLEKLIACFVRSELIMPRQLCYEGDNLMVRMYRDMQSEKRHKKGKVKRHKNGKRRD